MENIGLALSLSELIAIGSLFTGILIYIGKIKERLSRCEWKLSVCEKDINESRQVIERDVIKKFAKDLDKMDLAFYSYEAIIRNLQIRTNSVEAHLEEKTEYRRTNTHTDFDRYDNRNQ